MDVIKTSGRYSSVSSADHRQYLYKTPEMMQYLDAAFGKPDKTVKTPKGSDFSNMKGIIVVRGHGWKNAVGHVTLWNGKHCSDACHLFADPENSQQDVEDFAKIGKLVDQFLALPYAGMAVGRNELRRMGT